jgi:hypothetical protein
VAGSGALAAVHDETEVQDPGSGRRYDVKIQFMSVAGDPMSVLIKVAAAHHADRLSLVPARRSGASRSGPPPYVLSGDVAAR